ncbi:hypothetical protein RJ641_010727 [Dillenia turbinata]|uniref:NUC153 domain-containing protein n=1 Tax=Dillenia turbinata TaxID=194707 RepID=A0AAN8Z4J0_9MAGN
MAAKKNKQKGSSSKEEREELQVNENNKNKKKIITDSRFSSVHTDPRFQKLSKHKTKVPIDSRFSRIFSDKKFASSSVPFDKRGKPKKQTSESTLRHYYHFEEDEEEKAVAAKKKKREISNDEDDENESSDSESVSESETSDPGSNSESSTDDSDEEIEMELDDEPSEPEENISEIEKETQRLAVVNMDWTRVKAVDIYVLLSSFLPKGGQILSVSVYPSEFGLKRMEEEVHGPVGLFDDEEEKNDDDDYDDDDKDEINEKKLRAYEKSKLRYYYAVVECDSSVTADHLYKECDRLEFERSSNVLDLRFIPDDMEFKHPPRDVATQAPKDYVGLDFHTRALQHSKVHLTWDEDEPQRSKALKRKFNADQLDELEFQQFLASDESESDEDGDEDENENQSAYENENVIEEKPEKKRRKRDMYQALLQSGDGDGSDGDKEDEDLEMEVTFNTGLEDISKRILEKKDKKAETVWEAYLRKRREKKLARKNRSKYSSDDDSSDTDQEPPTEQPDDFFIEEPSIKKKGASDKKDGKEKQQQETDREAEASRAELELLLADDKGTDNGLKGYNLKPKKGKGKKDKKVPDEDRIPTADFDDPRFSALFTSPLFALDPTDPQFKRSATYVRQLAQKQQKGDYDVPVDNGEKKIPGATQLQSNDPEANSDGILRSDVPKETKHEISSLVRSIKLKSNQVQAPPKAKMPKKNEKSQVNLTEKEENHELSTMVKSVKKKAKGIQK